MTVVSLMGVSSSVITASASTLNDAQLGTTTNNDFDSWSPQQIADFFKSDNSQSAYLTHADWTHISPSMLQQAKQQGLKVGINNYPIIDERAGTSKIVKTAIKFLLSHKKQVIDEVGNIGGKSAKKALEKGFSAATPKLKKILKYESAAWGQVQGAFTSALISSGVKSTTARSVAYWVVTALKWLV